MFSLATRTSITSRGHTTHPTLPPDRHQKIGRQKQRALLRLSNWGYNLTKGYNLNRKGYILLCHIEITEGIFDKESVLSQH